MFELINTNNRNLNSYAQSFISKLFDDFSVQDINYFIGDILLSYTELLIGAETANSFGSVPMFNDIMTSVTYKFYRRLYDIYDKSGRLSIEDMNVLKNKLCIENAYIDLMEFTHAVLEVHKLTYAYYDGDIEDIVKVVEIINDAQLNIFNIL